MAVDSTLLMQEVANVIENGSGNSNRMYTFQILAGDKWITPIRVESLQTFRQYADNQYADVRMLEAKFTAGTFVFDLLKNRDALMADVTATELMPGTSTPAPDQPSITRRYHVMIANIDDHAASNKQSQLQTRDAVDQAIPPVDCVMQLIDETTWKLLMLSGGNNYRQMVPMDALYTELTALFKAMSTKDTERVLDIQISPGYNPTVRTNVVIPHGTHWKDMVFMINEKEGGLYKAGVGRYVQDQILYIYPLYDTVRYRKNSLVLSIINVPNDRYKGGEKTYKVDDQNVTIICTGTAKISDKSLFDKLVSGSASRFLDASKILGNIGLVKDGKMLIDKASNLFEVGIESLTGEKNNVQWAGTRATSNVYQQYSDLARKQGQDLTIEWTHADINLMYPGMPVKYQTIDSDAVETYYGVLLGVQEFRAPANTGAVNNRFPGKAVLTVRITRRVNDPNAEPITTATP